MQKEFDLKLKEALETIESNKQEHANSISELEQEHEFYQTSIETEKQDLETKLKQMERDHSESMTKIKQVNSTLLKELTELKNNFNDMSSQYKVTSSTLGPRSATPVSEMILPACTKRIRRPRYEIKLTRR